VLAEHYGQGRLRAVSGGTEPGEHIHPEVARVLEDLGLDTSRETPGLITADTVKASDVAVTMGCGDACPFSPDTRMLDWPLEDPKGRDDAAVRRIVADIDARVRDLVVALVPDLDLPPSVLERG
jgi:protein-tyrosine-phosphatase